MKSRDATGARNEYVGASLTHREPFPIANVVAGAFVALVEQRAGDSLSAQQPVHRRTHSNHIARGSPYGFWCIARAVNSGNLAISFASTPLVQPNPTCNKYSPPPPPPRCSDGSRSISYFSNSTPAS